MWKELIVLRIELVEKFWCLIVLSIMERTEGETLVIVKKEVKNLVLLGLG